MGQKTLERLECLRKLNSNKTWVNNDLYRLLYQEDLRAFPNSEALPRMS